MVSRAASLFPLLASFASRGSPWRRVETPPGRPRDVAQTASSMEMPIARQQTVDTALAESSQNVACRLAPCPLPLFRPSARESRATERHAPFTSTLPKLSHRLPRCSPLPIDVVGAVTASPSPRHASPRRAWRLSHPDETHQRRDSLVATTHTRTHNSIEAPDMLTLTLRRR